MSEYICREAILDDLEKEIEAGNIALDEDVWINKGLRIAIRDIKDIKTAAVQPVKHGKWITGDQWWTCRCSNCYHEFGVAVISANRQYLYCPHCGARMEGETNE